MKKALFIILWLCLCLSGFASVALMLSKNPELTPAQICQILEETSVRLTPTKSNVTGVGRVDALAALNAVPFCDGVTESQESQVLVFPNPSKDGFNIQCEGLINIEVFSMDGKLIKSIEPRGSQCFIDGLSSGMYLVRIVSGQGLTVRKIVKF